MNNQWSRVDALRLRGILDKMGLCGCGSVGDDYECVLELLTEAENHTDGIGFYRDKWFEFGAKVLDSWGLVEHGSGIGFAWLTDDGKILLRFLRDFGTEHASFDDPSGQPVWSIEFGWNELENPEDEFGKWQLQPQTVSKGSNTGVA